MESTKFNLEQSIHDYISVISNRGSITSADATELSAHIFDAAEALSRQGLSEEEAFIIATKRLGTEEVLTEEYSKVNTSVKTNYVWAYLMAGFSLFYALPAIVFSAVAVFYFFIYQTYQTSSSAVFIVTSFHILFMASVWYSLKFKRSVSYFIERQIERNTIPFLIVCFSLLGFVFVGKGVLYKAFPGLSVLYFPVYAFDSRWIEFTFYATVLSLLGVVVSLVFSVNKLEVLTPKTLLQKPATLFLLAFGLITEFLAASTRTFHINELLYRDLIFGLVYSIAAFSIVYYNRASNSKYLMTAFLPVFLLEMGASYVLLEKGAGYSFVSHALAIILGIAAGRFLAGKVARYVASIA
ncbi:MAG: permease prefix domain 1-containing protein [Bacteroidota bacterium]